MIDWDGEGVYSFDLLDSLEKLDNRLEKERGLRFTYVSRTETIIDGYVVRSRRHHKFPILNFTEYDPEMQRIFGITGRLVGSVIDYEPLEIAYSQLLPDTNFAVEVAKNGRIYDIPSPAEPIYFPPRLEDEFGYLS